MKSKPFYLTSRDAVKSVMNELLSIKPDGSIKVTFSDSKGKSGRQRGLQHLLYTDVANYGVGGRREDTPGGVDLVCKFHIAIPIMQRDDEFFRDLYATFKSRYEGDEDYAERLIHFIEHTVHTEKFNVSQMAEYLTGIYNRYAPMGVNLTQPEFQGLI